MKNSKRSKPKMGFRRLGNLSLPMIIGLTFAVFAISSVIYSGATLKYSWLLLPRGAFDLSVFTVIYVTVAAIIGATCGLILTTRMYRKLSDKIIPVCLHVGIMFLFIMWFNVIFSSFAFFGAFVISLILATAAVMAFIFTFKYFRLLTVLPIATVLLAFYTVWLSFSVMLIN